MLAAIGLRFLLQTTEMTPKSCPLEEIYGNYIDGHLYIFPVEQFPKAISSCQDSTGEGKGKETLKSTHFGAFSIFSSSLAQKSKIREGQSLALLVQALHEEERPFIH